MAIAAIILAGGKATRMGGVAKHAIVVDGRTILARLLAVLAPRCTEIVVASNAPIPGLGGTTIDAGAAAARVGDGVPGGGLGGEVRVVGDGVVGAGPLAGIAAGLAVVAAPWAIVVAGDMPFVSGAVVERLRERAIVNQEVNSCWDAVAYRVGGRPEPLCCALRVAAARPLIDAMLAAGDRRASDVLARLRVEWIEVAAGAEEAGAFANLNSPGDLPPGSGI